MNGTMHDMQAVTGVPAVRGRRRFTCAVIALFVLFAMSCSKQGYPPGGPDDETPPRLTSSVPAPFATGVARDTRVELEFSESMDVRTVEDNLFIVPIPPAWPVLEWEDRDTRLAVQFQEPLLDGTTYVISVGTKARDLRNNQLDEAILLSFSTGDTIENRKIRGTVIPATFRGEDRESVSAVDVAAYRLSGAAENPDPRRDIPDYVTQSGTDGGFELIGLSRGSYRLFAIGDRDRNGFYSEGYDMIGVSSADVTLAGDDSLALSPFIAVGMRDTSMVQLISISVPDSRRIELFFNRPVDAGSARIEIAGLDVREWFRPGGQRPMLSVATAEQQDGKRYEIAALEAEDAFGNSLMPLDTAPFFRGTDTPDTTALAVDAVEPELLVPGGAAVTVVFNRVLDLKGGPDDAVRSVEPSMDITVTRSAPNVLSFAPGDSWPGGTAVTVSPDRDTVRGHAGNMLTEDGAAVRFRVAAKDTLGFIGGTIEDPAPEGEYRLMFDNIDAGTGFEMTVGDTGPWETGPVLPGRYLLRAWRDDDGDGVRSAGSVKPFRFAEPVFELADTLAVVSRWTNGDNVVEFR